MSNASDFVIENGILKKYVGPGGDVVIPDGVTEIYSSAFRSCNRITQIVIPEGVNSIGFETFADCESLERVVFSESLTEIASWAFRHCPLLDHVSIPAGVKKLSPRAFADCRSLSFIEVSKNNPCYSSQDGAVLSKDKRTLLFVPGGLEGKDYSIPETVTLVDENAFLPCRGVNSVTVVSDVWPENLDKALTWTLADVLAPKISLSAIKDKTALVKGYALAYKKGIQYPESSREEYLAYMKRNRKKLLEYALSNKNSELILLLAGNGLISAEEMERVLDNFEQPEMRAQLLVYKEKMLTPQKKKTLEKKLQAKEESALVNALLPEDAKKNWNYEKNETGILLKSYKGNDTAVTIPEKIGKDPVVSIGELAFSPEQKRIPNAAVRRKISSVNIPDTVKDVHPDSFKSCVGLADAQGFISVSGTLYDYLGKSADIVIPNGTERIADAVFKQSKTLKSVVFPNCLKTIGESAFADCKKLKQIEFPESLKRISKFAFSGCENLSKIVFHEGLEEISYGAFQNCTNLSAVELPFSLRQIDWAFINCTKLKELTVPNSETSIKGGVAWRCASLADASGFVIVNGVLSDCVCVGTEKQAAIPEGVTKISGLVFYNDGTLEQVTFPKSLRTIEGNPWFGAFASCEKLTRAVFQNGIRVLGENAFSNCKNLEHVSIPGSVERIEQSVFECCQNLTIHAPAGSYAEQYAKENNIPFVAE